MRQHRIWALALVVALAGVFGGGCTAAKRQRLQEAARAQAERWCSVYFDAYLYVQSIAIPALDTAAAMGLAPAGWLPAYSAAKSALLALDATARSVCDGAQGEIDPARVGDVAAKAAATLIEIIQAHEALSPPPATLMGSRELTEGEALIERLRRVQAEATTDGADR